MKKPSFLSKGNTIGIVAPSFGIFDEYHLTRYNNAKRFFINEGFNIKEANSLFNENFLGVSNGYVRANEFMEMYLDNDVDFLISAAGGETMLEILEYIDFEKLKMAKPKYFLGYSDNTVMTFLLPTICGIESIYGIHATTFSDIFLDYVKDFYKFINGNKLEFNSYDKYEDLDGELTIPVNYIGSCDIKGIFLGGCLEVLHYICGTKYDNMANFNKENKNIIFYIEPYDMKPLDVLFTLWQLKNAGWFNNVVGFIFGRTKDNDTEYLTYVSAIHRALDDLAKPIIINADLGHIPPVIPFINGRMANVKVKDGKGVIIYDK